MNKCTERLYNGLVKENPTFVLMLGMCPTLAVTTSAINGVGMGLSTTVVLIMSNMLISMLRKIIPDSVRMPAFIVIVASFVTPYTTPRRRPATTVIAVRINVFLTILFITFLLLYQMVLEE